MQIELNAGVKLMDFHQKYSRFDLFDAASMPRVTAFANRLFEELTVVFRDELKGCDLSGECLEKKGCRAECSQPMQGSKLVIESGVGYKHLFRILYSNGTENKSLFSISRYTREGSDAARYVVDYLAVDPASENDLTDPSMFLTEGESFYSAKKRVIDIRALETEEEGKMIDHFKTSIMKFKNRYLPAPNQNNSGQNTPQTNSWLAAAFLAGIGIGGAGLGLYAHERSKQKELQKPKVLKIQTPSERAPLSRTLS